MLLLAENFTLKVLTCLAHKVLGISKLKYIWQFLTICMSFVLNIFIKKRLMTKSNDDNSGVMSGGVCLIEFLFANFFLHNELLKRRSYYHLPVIRQISGHMFIF